MAFDEDLERINGGGDRSLDNQPAAWPCKPSNYINVYGQ